MRSCPNYLVTGEMVQHPRTLTVPKDPGFPAPHGESQLTANPLQEIPPSSAHLRTPGHQAHTHKQNTPIHKIKSVKN